MLSQETEVRLVTCRWCGSKVLANMYLKHLDRCPGYQRWIRRKLKVRGKALRPKP